MTAADHIPEKRTFTSGEWIKVEDIAHARSGDKGDMVNIAFIAHHPEYHQLLKQLITPNILAEWFKGWTEGPFEVWSVPGVSAINCLIHSVLQGGGAISLRLDAQGKALGQVLLQAPLQIP